MCSIIGACVDITALDNDTRREFHEFLSCLFMMGELRGTDAAGFWAWRNDHYVFEKRPIAAQDLIDRSAKWKSLKFSPASLYLCHNRFATQGDPNKNINNHPHIGSHSVMVHNGCVYDHKKLMSENKVEIASECDSEVLLRLVEQKDTIKEGIEHLFSRIDFSTTSASMAIAMVDRRNPNKIYLFRNSGNPCYLYYSKRFKAFFFASTDTIFEQALQLMYDDKKLDNIDAVGGQIETETLYILEPGKNVVKEKLEFEKRWTQSSWAGGHYNFDSDDDNDTVITKKDKKNPMHLCAEVYMLGENFTLDAYGSLEPHVTKEKSVALTTKVAPGDIVDMSQQEQEVFEDFLETSGD